MLDEILTQQTGRLKKLVELAEERVKLAKKRNMLLGIIIGIVLTLVVIGGIILYLMLRANRPMG